MTETRTTCPYCGVGCGVIVRTEAGADRIPRLVSVRGDPDHPANFGRLCSKGTTLAQTATDDVHRHARLRQPMRRTARGEAPVATGWDTALDAIAGRLADVIARRGPDAVGVYLSGQLTTEDYAVFNKLARGLVGTNNVDTNSRLCMSSAVSGYRQSLGADAPPACYDDIADAGCLFIAGSNAAWAHPVLYRRIEDARAANPSLRTIVVDPRATDTARDADLHLPLAPGSDVALCHAMLHVMVWEGWLDDAFVERHTRGFAELKRLVAGWTPRDAARPTGLTPAQIETAARWFAWGGDVEPSPGTAGALRRGTLSLYCQGLNQSRAGTAKNTSLINLHLACGQIGRAGAGPFSLTGQPNAMGGREAGGLATALPGHRDPANAGHRAEVAAIWGVPSLPERPGLPAVAMFEAAARGEIELLWIVCTNPAMSLPDQGLVRAALERCPTVIVQEAFTATETTAFADWLLPAATWGERDGTVTNSERRISRTRAAVPPPGEARPDWRIAADVAQRLEVRLGRTAVPGGAGSAFAYADAEAVWNEHRATTVGRDLDIGGLSWAVLDRDGPQCWPMPAGATAGRARLYEDHRFATDDGRASFVAAPFVAPAETPDARHPFTLTTGRLRDQWHGMTRTGTVPGLFAHAPQPVLQLHPQDLARRGLREGDLAEVRSRRGSLVLPVQADAGLRPLQAHLPMHWGARFVGGRDAQGRARAGINGLTHGQVCPQSRQPELKHAAVAIARAELPWRLQAAAWLPPAEAAVAREALVGLMDAFAHARCVPVASPAGADAGVIDGRIGLVFEAAAASAPDAGLLDRLEAAIGLHRGVALRFADPRRGARRTVRLAVDGDGAAAARVDALLRAAQDDTAAWLLPAWTTARPLGPAAAVARALLRPDAPGPAAADGASTASREVCSCLRVDECRIRAALAALPGDAAARLAGLQASLRCGTQCGSCRPELRRLVAAVAPAAHPNTAMGAASRPADPVPEETSA